MKLSKLVLMKLVPVKMGNGEKKFLQGNTIGKIFMLELISDMIL